MLLIRLGRRRRVIGIPETITKLVERINSLREREELPGLQISRVKLLVSLLACAK
jgi:hypothetical protein